MKKCFAILAFMSFIGCSVSAQEINFSEIWTSYSVKYSLNKQWKVYGESQWRFDNRSETPNPFFLEFAGRRKINKVAALKFQYRYTWVYGERNTQRLAVDGRFKWKVWDKKLIIQYRTRAQIERVSVNGQIISDWRNKIGIERVFTKKFSIYLDYENFMRLLKLRSFVRLDPPRLNQNRYTLGAKYEFKKNEFVAFYRIDQSVDLPSQLFQIIGFGITRKLN